MLLRRPSLREGVCRLGASPFPLRSPSRSTLRCAPIVSASGGNRNGNGNGNGSEPGPTYRRCVGVCVVNANNEVLVARRADLPSVEEAKQYASGGKHERVAWQMPQGGVDEGEELAAACMRELHEETGMVSAHILHELPGWLTYDFPEALMAKWLAQGRGWGGQYRGQAQRWFLLRFTGLEEEIDLSGIGEVREFTEWKWMPIEDLADWVVPFKRDVYVEVADTFGAYLKAQKQSK
eukprot:CAMPEP_0198200286 /NCGR_PEP_ID=MMETSP1445-20131203/3326_1 /TAXON_ID=36898 /ORGANISM="Pyramimonas sp., Strain CCMP2087" /LENGTH=235 /DNA_ID=CAMNT_0043870303 /DNA_START=233 /DNA_END=940 /DNA_ORIENTATION=+